MGLDIDDYKYGQLEIPDFDNPLRLVIVSLNELFTYLKEMNFDPNNPNRIVKFRYKRSIRKKNDDESVPEYWNRIVSIGNHTAIAEISELDIIELPILDFDNWTTFLVNNLQEDHT
jgi:hypothetical protein